MHLAARPRLCLQLVGGPRASRCQATALRIVEATVSCFERPLVADGGASTGDLILCLVHLAKEIRMVVDPRRNGAMSGIAGLVGRLMRRDRG